MVQTKILRHGGGFWEDFVAGQHCLHRSSLTLTEGLIAMFADQAFGANPLHRNHSYAQALGYAGCPVPAALLFALGCALSSTELEVRMLANAGFDRVGFGVPLYCGDTLTCESLVLECALNPTKPDRGQMRVQTLVRNQYDQVAMVAVRRLVLRRHAPQAEAQNTRWRRYPTYPTAPPIPSPILPWAQVQALERHLAPAGGYAEDLRVGDTIEHGRAYTLTGQHVEIAARLGYVGAQTRRPLRHAAATALKPPRVFYALALAYGLGAAAREVGDQALAELEWTQVRFHRAVGTGDTISAISRIVGVEPYAGDDLVQIEAETRVVALRWGHDPDPVITLRRKLIVKRRSHYYGSEGTALPGKELRP